MPNQVVLYCAHTFNHMILGEIARLRAELPDLDHRVIGYLKDDVPWPETLPSETVLYRRDALTRLPYPAKLARVDWRETTGNNDLSPLAFYREHPRYSAYWLVEYDVRYTGSWRDLFAKLSRSDADLLATTVQDYEENPHWYFWQSLVNTRGRRLQRVRAFLPFCRVSSRALAAIDRWYQQGGGGHYELVWPSVCKSYSLKIEDIGGTGRYTPRKRRGKHYFNSPLEASLSPGTFVFRPIFQHAMIEEQRLRYAGGPMGPMLWHPIKV